MKTPQQIADSLTTYGQTALTREQHAIAVAAIEADRAQRELEGESIYWDEADDDQPETHAFGGDTAQIVDEEQGGAIAYCHRDNANEIVKALLAYRKGWR